MVLLVFIGILMLIATLRGLLLWVRDEVSGVA